MKLFKAGAAASCALQAGQAVAEILYAGVNSAGGEFAQQNLPGIFGMDFLFINETAIDFFLESGVNTIRLPFLLERMCPLATGLGSVLNETYFTELSTAVHYITTKGAYVILDAHNYMRYNDPSMQPFSGSVIGNDTLDAQAATVQNLADFWAELSRRFIINTNVIFGLMNEPHDMPTTLVLESNQAMIDAIRGVGAQQLILVPGNGFTGAHRWLNTTCQDETLECTPNADVLSAITDPLDNFAFDMHLYFDNDTSGTHEECTLNAPSNLFPVTAWLQENNYTAVLSEFGAGSNPTCFETLNNTITHLEDSGVFIGWTYWSAGPLWGDYFLSIEPDEGPAANSTWPLVLEPKVRAYEGLLKCGISGNGKGGVGESGRGAEGCVGMK